MTGYESQDVNLDVRDGVATITVARPTKINAMRLSTWRGSYAHVVATDQDSAVDVIVIRGAGHHFGAGNDIDALSTFADNLAAALDFGTAWATAFHAVEDTSKPVLMMSEGICYGAVLPGDLRIVSSNAVFSIHIAKLGALYLRSHYQRLLATLGLGQSKKLIYSSDVFDAEPALCIGLADEVILNECFDIELQHLVDSIRLRSPFTLRTTKAMLLGLASHAVERENSVSLALCADSTQHPDFKEGISAFLARRSARFR